MVMNPEMGINCTYYKDSRSALDNHQQPCFDGKNKGSKAGFACQPVCHNMPCGRLFFFLESRGTSIGWVKSPYLLICSCLYMFTYPYLHPHLLAKIAISVVSTSSQASFFCPENRPVKSSQSRVVVAPENHTFFYPLSLRSREFQSRVISSRQVFGRWSSPSCASNGSPPTSASRLRRNPGTSWAGPTFSSRQGLGGVEAKLDEKNGWVCTFS